MKYKPWYFAFFKGGMKSFFWIGILIFFQPGLILAHLPHDDITLLELSPNFSNDNFLLVTERKNLLRSTNGGDSWKRLVRGLDYDSEITGISISYDFEYNGVIYMSTNGDGIFKSEDAGNSWHKINTGLSTLRIGLLYAPRCDGKGVIYAAGEDGALFKCENGCEDWIRLLNPGEIDIASIIVSRNNPQQLIIGCENGDLYVFNCVSRRLDKLSHDPGRGAINVVAFPPNTSSNETFLMGTQKRGVMKTVDGGKTFEGINADIFNQPIMSLAFSPDYDHNKTIYVSTWFDGVFCSKDGGQTWQHHSKGLSTDPQADAGKLPHFRTIKMSNGFSTDGVMFLNGFDALFKTTDRGNTWRAVETLPAKLIVDFDISPAYNDGGEVAWVTYAGAAYIMDNFHACSFKISNCGIGYAAIRRPVIKFSPDYENDQSIFSASNNVFLKSGDCGGLWESNRMFNILGLPLFFERFVQNPEYYQRRYVATSIVASPDIGEDNTLYMATRKKGLFRSKNGGKTFKEIFKANQHLTTAMAISPDFVNDHVLFIGIAGDKKIYMTDDRGDSWHPVDKGDTIEGIINCIAISPEFKADNVVFAGTRNGLFRSDDGGNHWEKAGGDSFNGHHHVDAIAISPNFKNDRELIVSIRGEGIFKSVDAGGHFMQIGASLIEQNHPLSIYYGFPERPLPIKYSPAYQVDRTIYGTSGEELFMSTNGGLDWEIIPRPVRYEDIRRDVINYEKESLWVKQWNQDTFDCDKLSAHSVTLCDTKGAKVNFKFNGSGVSWIGTRSKNQGVADVYLDGRLKARIDQYSAAQKTEAKLFTISGLENKPHTLTIEVSGAKAEDSEGYFTVIDAIDIFPYDDDLALAQ